MARLRTISFDSSWQCAPNGAIFSPGSVGKALSTDSIFEALFGQKKNRKSSLSRDQERLWGRVLDRSGVMLRGLRIQCLVA